MENKNGSGIFLGVIGVATLVVAIIGATFAFFSATTNSAENAISTSSTTLGLNYVDDTGTKLSTSLIPASETVATYGAISKTYLATEGKSQCVDDNGNDVCSVYQFTVTNPNATTSQAIDFTLKVVTNEFTNLKYKIYSGSVSDALDTGATPVVAAANFGAKDSETTLSALSQTLAPSGSVTYTMVIWVNETGNDQTSADSGKSFSAGLTVTSGSGQGVTGIIAGAQM